VSQPSTRRKLIWPGNLAEALLALNRFDEARELIATVPRLALARYDRVICVSPPIRDAVASLGIGVERLEMTPAFLGLTGLAPSRADLPPRWQAWMRAHRSEPMFVWVHLFDPHTPYGAPMPFLGRFGTPGDPPPTYRGNAASRDPYPSTEVRVMTALYDDEIAYADDLAGQLVALADELAPPGNPPLVVVTADHGETLAERDRTHRYAFDHGQLLYRHEEAGGDHRAAERQPVLQSRSRCHLGCLQLCLEPELGICAAH